MGEPKFGEPLEITEHDEYVLADRDGNTICYGGFTSGRHMERAVACVNALSGVDHPGALPALLQQVGDTCVNHAMQPYTEVPCACGLCTAYRALFSKEENRG